MIPTKRSHPYAGDSSFPEPKRLRTTELWKTHLCMKEQPLLGLRELFGGGGGTEQERRQQHQGGGNSSTMNMNFSSQNMSENINPNNNNRSTSRNIGGRRNTTQRAQDDDSQQALFPRPDGRRNTANHADDGKFPYMFRLERREGGALARHAGEERILLFRSDRPGAIAKIIFSSKPAIVRKKAASSSPPLSDGPEKEGPKKTNPAKASSFSGQQYCSTIKNNEDAQNEGGNNEEDKYDEEELNQMAQATIHVLDVKEQYRGRDLGGLLFSEATSALRVRYDHHHLSFSQDEDDGSADGFSSSVRCQLDAEEDVRRHNKLVHFYESLGCRIKPRATVRYLNNNDGETYRRVPMQIALRPGCENRLKYGARHHHPARRRQSLVGKEGIGFLPVRILESKGSRVSILPHSSSSPPRRLDHWLMLDDGSGSIEIMTTQGHRMCAEPDGRVSVLSPEEFTDMECYICDHDCAEVARDDEKKPSAHDTDTWCKFKLCRVPDIDYDSDSSSSFTTTHRKELWTLLTQHGTYLTTDPVSHALGATKVPSFWQANKSNLTLVCTRDTPPRRMHYRQKWLRQTVNYVRTMRDKYFKFGLGVMTLRSALDDIATSIPCRPFCVSDEGCPNLRSLCYCTAEEARRSGQPDWVQLVALLHDMGRVVAWLDARASTATTSNDGHDWTITSRSRIVGCAAPDRATFAEFRHLNPDESDDRYNTLQGMYHPHIGLDNTWLTWTGPEYMYYMLKHNGCTIPEEGMAMLRYFSLGDWHEHDEYATLTNDDDADVQYFVSDFDRMRRRAWKKCREKTAELADRECMNLWDGYYAGIAAKYNCVGDLKW